MNAQDSQSKQPHPLAGVEYALVLGFLAGPIAGIVDVVLSYMLVTSAQKVGDRWPLHAVTALTLMITAVGAFLSWRGLQHVRRTERQSRPTEPLFDEASEARARFLAVGGLLMCAFMFLVVVALAVPRFVLGLGD